MSSPNPLPSPAAPSAPRPPGEYAALIGLDWGDQKHALALRPRNAPVEHTHLPHSAETVHAWLEALGQRFGGQPIAVAVEASKGALLAALLEYSWIVVYPIHPATSRRFSTAFRPSGAKDDPPDADVLLDLLTCHRARLRALVPFDAATRRVQLLTELRRKQVDQRTLLTNQLTSLLKGYFPQALDLVGVKLSAPMALAFLERWPELALLQRARPETVRTFYYAHGVRRAELVEKRVALVQAARPLTSDRVLCEVSMLQLRVLVAEIRLLGRQLDQIEEALASAFAAHPDAGLFRELPGAGAALAPRLCALFGTDRARWADASELQKGLRASLR